MSQELIKLVTAGDTAFGVVREPDGSTRVAISGNLLMQNRDQFKQLMLERLAAGDREFILDLSRCGYIDSVGCGVLVSVAKKIAEADGTLVLEGLNEDLVTLFELTHLDKHFTIRRTDG